MHQMRLQFTPRQGDHLNWQRALTVYTPKGVAGPFLLKMVTVRDAEGRDERHGAALDAQGMAVWKGKLALDVTPLRAFAVAAGLCDDQGNSDIELPQWVADRVLKPETE